MAKGSDNKFPKVIITEGSAPSNADSGDQKLYIDSSDHKLKRKDSSGTVVSIEDAGSGAPTTSKYVTTAADGGLSAEVVIPGMAAHADIAGSAGAGSSREFESGDTAPTWSSAPAATDVGVTFPSHLYVSVTDAATRYGLYDWSPAGDFDARCCCDAQITSYTTTPDWDFGMSITNSDGSVNLTSFVQVHTASTAYKGIQALTWAGSFTTRATVTTLQTAPRFYLRIKRVSSTCTWYWSTNGLMWQTIYSGSHTITVAKIGVIAISGTNVTSAQGIMDWLRTDV